MYSFLFLCLKENSTKNLNGKCPVDEMDNNLLFSQIFQILLTFNQNTKNPRKKQLLRNAKYSLIFQHFADFLNFNEIP